ncbi:hypothetical protein JW899_03490 [Candidatus Uhrbacteria bacterium]|nr:hypothetical protein [Candidatus Uhrbacteria bacterium]
MEFCPAILAKTESEFREKADRVHPLGLTFHVDVMDGKFVAQTCWADPMVVPEIADGRPFEVHLMVRDPEHVAAVWLAAGARRVWVHAESTDRELMIMRSDPKNADRIGLALNPETPISRITPVIDSVSSVMVMGVTPGSSGQAFQEITLEKIAILKELRPNLWIKVDGGVNKENIARIAAAGADAVAAATALTDAPDPKEALDGLRKALT